MSTTVWIIVIGGAALLFYQLRGRWGAPAQGPLGGQPPRPDQEANGAHAGHGQGHGHGGGRGCC